MEIPAGHIEPHASRRRNKLVVHGRAFFVGEDTCLARVSFKVCDDGGACYWPAPTNCSGLQIERPKQLWFQADRFPDLRLIACAKSVEFRETAGEKLRRIDYFVVSMQTRTGHLHIGIGVGVPSEDRYRRLGIFLLQ